MEINIIKVMMILAITITTSLVIELNNLSSDIMKNKRKIPLYYASKIFLNAIIGTTTGISCSLISSNVVIFFIVAILGTFLGKRSFLIISTIIKNTTKAFKNIDIDKLIEDNDDDS